ncbi:MAG: AAA family ATPase [Bacteroidia bacterium]
MKICSIRIKGYQQFEDIFLDFTHPETGEPLDKICFIGRNGTGKSTILNLINNTLNQFHKTEGAHSNSFLANLSDPIGEAKILLVKLKLNNRFVYHFSSPYSNTLRATILKPEIESIGEDWLETISHEQWIPTIEWGNSIHQHFAIEGKELETLVEENLFHDNRSDLLIYSPAESGNNSYLSVSDVPQTNLNEALKLFQNFPFNHLVSDENVHEFWRLLIFLIKKRDSEREAYENNPENLNKTKKQLIQEFDAISPRILDGLAVLWNKILEKAGLEFDVDNAQNPIQLTENLHAYIRLKKTKQKIRYDQLSTGIRNFIFRIGHIYTLYFNREIKRGFLLVDEPENSLFPDFLFELMETYQEIVKDKNGENNTQFFVSTHNPIIAAQFEPHERIILEWNEDGYVEASKGHAPAGDDPNDVLEKDFKLTHLMGKKGQEMWAEYLQLRKQLRRTQEEEKKKDLISQINEIGTAYNFEE